MKIQLTYSLLLIIHISLLSFSYEAICQRYFCMNAATGSNPCTTVTPISENGKFSYFNIFVNLCGGLNYCKVGDFSQNSTSSFNCEASPITMLVDGESCRENAQCSSELCEKKVCVGFPIGRQCTSHFQCKTGTYCNQDTRTCQEQKNITGVACKEDAECPNQSGCLNSQCTKYFSLPPKTKIASSALAELYCNTSFSYDGVCATVEIQNQLPYECNASTLCSYKILENNNIITLPEACVCGYNSLGKSYCMHGSNSLSLKKYHINKLDILDRGCQVAKKDSCSNQLSRNDISDVTSLYLSWKGYFQLSESCIVNFYSSCDFLRGSYYYWIAIVFLIIFY